MHPILARGRRLALYLGAWALVGILLAGPGGFGVSLSLGIALPLAIVYAFFCLSAWYVSRSTPLGPTGSVRLVTTALTASIISSAAWLLVARGWLEIVAPVRRSPPCARSSSGSATEALLDPARFVRIHRSFLLNIERIARVELYAKDSRIAILRDGTKLPVSRAGYARLGKML